MATQQTIEKARGKAAADDTVENVQFADWEHEGFDVDPGEHPSTVMAGRMDFAQGSGDNFDAFWKQTLEGTRSFPLNFMFARVDFGIKTLQVYDVTFSGWQGQPIKGWFLPSGGKTFQVREQVKFLTAHLG